jgi:hypothetical protein
MLAEFQVLGQYARFIRQDVIVACQSRKMFDKLHRPGGFAKNQEMASILVGSIIGEESI